MHFFETNRKPRSICFIYIDVIAPSRFAVLTYLDCVCTCVIVLFCIFILQNKQSDGWHSKNWKQNNTHDIAEMSSIYAERERERTD